MPTGWRPADVADKYPVYKIEDPYNFEKYDPSASRALIAWSWVQLLFLLLFISYLFGNIALIGKPAIFVYGGFIFLTVYAFTELMDKNRHAIIWEFVRCILGIGIMYYYGDWFGASAFVPGIKYILAGYFIFSVAITFWLSTRNRQTENSSLAFT